ncbi:major facilitator superfamily domain-containing protein [Microdochium trichocladiopsis]|uniref:Major facilitator superfamily domain-containing protein n=1 Tax=Microdochium trichocladiopsis TaxID=1682393 RepID=A0A9P8XTL5_9PEZI|nr:major facilitator superfamily domain-containing protein [Microdochium trichocladiopsis]KAH7016532.1 major facilitator superfamily domain-containing protein [Microdochium trichocladiopsis]
MPTTKSRVNKATSAEWKPSAAQYLVMATLSSLSLMVSLDASILVTSLHAIIVDLRIDTTQGFWIATSYLLANTISMPSAAALSDIFGRRNCLFVSLTFFSAGSVVCSVAQGIAVMLVGRCLQGIGGGGIIILSLVIFTDIVPLDFRPKWYAMILGAWALGNCTGPTIGGAIAQYTTWRWVFYLVFPFCGVGFVMILLMPQTPIPESRLGNFDWLGCVSFTASITSFLIAISWGGVQYSWTSAPTLAPLVAGVCGLAATLFLETRVKTSPFLHLRLFRSVRTTAPYVCGLLQGLLLYGQLYYIPFYFQSVKGFTALETGKAIIPVAVALVVGSVMSGIVITRLSHFGYPIWGGWGLTTLATGLTLLWDRDTHQVVWVVTLLLLGLGHGAVLNAQNIATQQMAGGPEHGTAAAMYGFLRQFGMALGVAAGTAAFQNVMALKLDWQGLSQEIAIHSESYVAELSQLPDGSDTKAQILQAYLYGFRGVFGFFTAVSGVALLVSLLAKPKESRGRRRLNTR